MPERVAHRLLVGPHVVGSIKQIIQITRPSLLSFYMHILAEFVAQGMITIVTIGAAP